MLNANRKIGALVDVAAVGAVLHGTTSWSLKPPACLALLAIAFVRQTQKMFSEGASSGASAA